MNQALNQKSKMINSTYSADASVPVVAQYVALNKLHTCSMRISSYMQVLDKQSECGVACQNHSRRIWQSKQ